MNTLTHFQQSLDAELRERAALPLPVPAPARRARPPRRMLLAAGTAAAAITVAVAVPLSTGSGSPAAFAVTPHSDGTVGVQLFSPQGIVGLQAALRRLHIPAVATAATQDCKAKPTIGQHVKSTDPLVKVIAGQRVVPGKGTLTLIRPSAIPPGETLLISVYTFGFDHRLPPNPPSGPTTVVEFGLVHQVPACVTLTPFGPFYLLPSRPASK